MDQYASRPGAGLPGDGPSGARLVRSTTVAMAVLAFLSVLALGKNIASPNFWFDEADQFWLALGQTPYAQAGTPGGSWHDVWLYSQSLNADPGGFTVLLRLWIEAMGSSPLCMRLLPALFAALFLCLTYVWARRMTVPRPAAIAIALLFLLSQNVPYFTFELRAYSMELCGVVALWLATQALLERPSGTGLAIWIGIDFLFLTSRYSFVIYAASACGVLFLRAFSQPRARGIFLSAIAATLVWLAVLYVGMLRFQSADATPPPYVAELVLKGHWALFPAILAKNLFHPAAIGTTAFIAALLVTRVLRRRGVVAISPPQWQSFLALALYIVLAELAWFILSAFGKMPWDISKRWGLSLYGLSALSIPALYAVLRLGLKDRVRPALGQAGLAALCTASLAIGGLSLWVMAKRFDREHIVPEHLYQAMTAVDCTPGNTILLDDDLWPDYRYLTERSGLPIPCGGRLPVLPVRVKNIAAYASIGLSHPRPITYVFGSWDPQWKVGVLRRLQGHGALRVESFGPSDFTTVVTLR